MPEKKAKGGRSSSAFMSPVQPDDALAQVVGSEPMPRTEITKRLWDYIKKHNLQDPNNKRTIKADDRLRPIFDGKSEVSMFEMTKLVNGHIRK